MPATRPRAGSAYLQGVAFLLMFSVLVSSVHEAAALPAPGPSLQPDATPKTAASSTTATAQVGTGANSQSAALLVTLINIARIRADVPPLLIDTDLVDAANAASTAPSNLHLAGPAALSGALDSSWTRAGELRGSAPSVVDYLDAILASEDHRELVTDPEFTRIGVVVQLDDEGATVRQLLVDGKAPVRHPVN